MLKHLPAFALLIPFAFPMCGYCQSYADSPFYQAASAIPQAAHVEGWSHGSIKANGVVVDLSIAAPWSSPDRKELGAVLTNSWVDRDTPAHIFHYFNRSDALNVVFGYDLRVEPVEGTDQIKCTFSALTDPGELSENAWRRDKDIPVVALGAVLTPVVIKSGDAISITTLPLGPGKIAVVHYLRLTRMDQTPAPTE